MTYTIKEIMDRYQVTERTVLHWIKSGQLKVINVGRDPGKKKPRWRVTQEGLDAFELSRVPERKPRTVGSRRRRSQAAEVVEFYP